MFTVKDQKKAYTLLPQPALGKPANQFSDRQRTVRKEKSAIGISLWETLIKSQMKQHSWPVQGMSRAILGLSAYANAHCQELSPVNDPHMHR
jgi:hypothetical protein